MPRTLRPVLVAVLMVGGAAWGSPAAAQEICSVSSDPDFYRDQIANLEYLIRDRVNTLNFLSRLGLADPPSADSILADWRRAVADYQSCLSLIERGLLPGLQAPPDIRSPEPPQPALLEEAPPPAEAEPARRDEPPQPVLLEEPPPPAEAEPARIDEPPQPRPASPHSEDEAPLDEVPTPGFEHLLMPDDLLNQTEPVEEPVIISTRG